MAEPRTVAVNLRVSPKFKKWLAKEKKRRKMTGREIMEALALTYYFARMGKGVTPWDID